MSTFMVREFYPGDNGLISAHNRRRQGTWVHPCAAWRFEIPGQLSLDQLTWTLD